MADTYPCRAALVEGGVVRAVVTCHSQANRDGYNDVAKTYTMEDAKTLCLPQKLRLEIIDALRAKQDAADLAETGRRLMERSRLNGSGGAPDLGGPPAQKPPGPKLSDYACKICGSVPSELGVIEHGQCCHAVDSDGGGTSFVDLPDPVVAPFKAVPLTREDNLLIALHDAIRRPMGVVPTSAEPFVTDEGLAAAEKRRPRQVSQHCECHERDSSQVCDYCYANGRRGHMQKG